MDPFRRLLEAAGLKDPAELAAALDIPVETARLRVGQLEVPPPAWSCSLSSGCSIASGPIRSPRTCVGSERTGNSACSGAAAPETPSLSLRLTARSAGLYRAQGRTSDVIRSM